MHLMCSSSLASPVRAYTSLSRLSQGVGVHILQFTILRQWHLVVALGSSTTSHVAVDLAQIENAMKSLKDDPEMGEIFSELESGGPAAMMKYWNDPNVLKKLGDTMGGVFDFQVGRCDRGGHTVVSAAVPWPPGLTQETTGRVQAYRRPEWDAAMRATMLDVAVCVHAVFVERCMFSL